MRTHMSVRVRGANSHDIGILSYNALSHELHSNGFPQPSSGHSGELRWKNEDDQLPDAEGLDIDDGR